LPSPRGCRYCQQLFQPSKFRRDQSVCGQPECQRKRRTDDHRHRLEIDAEYAQVVRDSRRKWRQAHPEYLKNYRQAHAAQVERNRQQQRRRDLKRRLQNLAKNNLALDLKQTDAEIYLFAPAGGDLERNNLARSQLLIFQPLRLEEAGRAVS
jgi:hypothetical protein